MWRPGLSPRSEPAHHFSAAASPRAKPTRSNFPSQTPAGAPSGPPTAAGWSDPGPETPELRAQRRGERTRRAAPTDSSPVPHARSPALSELGLALRRARPPSASRLHTLRPRTPSPLNSHPLHLGGRSAKPCSLLCTRLQTPSQHPAQPPEKAQPGSLQLNWPPRISITTSRPNSRSFIFILILILILSPSSYFSKDS